MQKRARVHSNKRAQQGSRRESEREKTRSCNNKNFHATGVTLDRENKDGRSVMVVGGHRSFNWKVALRNARITQR